MKSKSFLATGNTLSGSALCNNRVSCWLAWYQMARVSVVDCCVTLRNSASGDAPALEKAPKLLLWNPLGRHITSLVNECLVISLENMGLHVMMPGCSGTERQQPQRRQYSQRGKVSPPLPKPASTPLPCCALALIWGTSVTLHHSYTLGPEEKSPCAHPAYLLCNHKRTHSRFGGNTQTTVQHSATELDTCTQTTLKHGKPERSGLADRAHTHWHQSLYTFYSVAGNRTL